MSIASRRLGIAKLDSQITYLGVDTSIWLLNFTDTLACAAILVPSYDGRELPEEIHPTTKAAATARGGPEGTPLRQGAYPVWTSSTETNDRSLTTTTISENTTAPGT